MKNCLTEWQNFKNGDLNFIKKKQRSLNYLHDLYLRLLERSKIRRSEYLKFYDSIKSKVNPSGDSIYLYYKQEDLIRGYKINIYDGSYTHYDPKFKNRNDKLNFILNCEKINFDLGEELKKQISINRNLFLYRIKKRISDKIHEHFSSIYNFRECKIQNIKESFLIVEISGVKYVVNIDNKNHYYCEFKWHGEIFKNDYISLNNL
jgi:hypothetical protein